MLLGTYTAIRTTEPDDAPWLHPLYDPMHPRAALLDPRREPLYITRDELREALTKRDVERGTFFTVEDSAGRVLGFCSLRHGRAEAGFGEVSVLFLDDADYTSAAAGEVGAFLRERAFERHRLRKVIGHALDHETGLNRWLQDEGYTFDGAYREVLWHGGRWHNMHSWTLAAPGATIN